MPISAVIFDFGGVLVRTEDQAGRREWEARLGLAPGDLDKLVFGNPVAARASVGLAGDADVWQWVAGRLRLDAEQMDRLQLDFWRGDRLDPRLVDFLNGLRPAYKTAILSNAWPGARASFVEHFGLDGVVDEMVISAEEGIAKPDPRIYRIAVGRLGVPPEAAVFVDDVLDNVESARRAGLLGVHFRNTAQALAEVREHLNHHK